MFERFDVVKIVNAIQKAAWATGVELDYEVIEKDITLPLEKLITQRRLTVEEIQDQVEFGLMKNYPAVAKAYILYREARNRERQKRMESQNKED